MKAREDEKTQPSNNGAVAADTHSPLDNRVGAGQNMNAKNNIETSDAGGGFGQAEEDLWWVPAMVLVVFLFVIPVLLIIGIIMGWL